MPISEKEPGYYKLKLIRLVEQAIDNGLDVNLKISGNDMQVSFETRNGETSKINLSNYIDSVISKGE